jgi:hypothetical protein
MKFQKLAQFTSSHKEAPKLVEGIQTLITAAPLSFKIFHELSF